MSKLTNDQKVVLKVVALKAITITATCVILNRLNKSYND